MLHVAHRAVELSSCIDPVSRRYNNYNLSTRRAFTIAKTYDTSEFPHLFRMLYSREVLIPNG